MHNATDRLKVMGPLRLHRVALFSVLLLGSRSRCHWLVFALIQKLTSLSRTKSWCLRKKVSASTHEICDDTNIAWMMLVQDLEQLPSRRVSKIRLKTQMRKENFHDSLKRTFHSCPQLIELYTPKKQSDQSAEFSVTVSPLQRLVDHVGLIDKRRLIEMLARHPNAMASVLMSTNNLRVRTYITHYSS